MIELIPVHVRAGRLRTGGLSKSAVHVFLRDREALRALPGKSMLQADMPRKGECRSCTLKHFVTETATRICYSEIATAPESPE